ncbi:MAG: hypothetical protein RIT45_2813 [Pseudomonadota bacterium]
MTTETTSAAQPRLFVLEEGVAHPLDVALGPGAHELRDLGVRLQFGADGVRASWLGYGPTAFALPGVRQLRAGDALRLADGDVISYAGRSWRLTAAALPGEERAPPRGVSKNAGGAGRPLDAVLLVIGGPDRGNFHRARTEATEWAAGVWLRGRTEDDAVLVEVCADRAGTLEVEDGDGARALEPGPWHGIDGARRVLAGDTVATLVRPRTA